MNASEALMELLLEQGVDLVFGYPGAAVLHIYDALYKYSDRICHVTTAHEQGAAHAADGYARLTGKTGVVFATSGPGAANLVTGIAAAYMDSVPLVAITGNVATNLIGRDSFQEVYIAGITLPITKHNFVVRSAAELPGVVRAAFRIAQEGRKGPVLIDIPKDVSAAPCAYDSHAKLPQALPVSPDIEMLQRAAQALNQAKQPVIFFGGGVQAANAGNALRALCAKGDIPAAHTLMAAGVLRHDYQYNLGQAGLFGSRRANQAIENSDVLLIAGSRLSDRVAPGFAEGFALFAPKAVKIHIDIDAAELGKNVPADIAIRADARAALDNLLPLLEEKTRPAWHAKISAWRGKEEQSPAGESELRPYQIMHAMGELAGEDAIYTTDVGQHQMWAAQYLRHVKPRRFLTSGGLGAMGYGYGAAIGAAVGANGRPVIHITGDGSFHMNMTEACAAVRYGLPVISVILNNSALGMVRQWQGVHFGRRYCATEPERHTDYIKLAEGFGLQGFRCGNIEEFKEIFAKALQMKTPVWIECRIDREERVEHGF